MSRLQFCLAFAALCFTAAWYLGGSIAWGFIFVLALPGIMLGLAIVYSITALADGWGKFFATAAGLGITGVAAQAFDEGISADDASGLFLMTFAFVTLLKGAQIYIEPAFVRFWQRLS